MGLISKTYTFSTGATIVAAEHNTNFDTLYDEINGNLDAANIDITSLGTIEDNQTYTGNKTFSGNLNVTGTLQRNSTDLVMVNHDEWVFWENSAVSHENSFCYYY